PPFPIRSLSPFKIRLLCVAILTPKRSHSSPYPAVCAFYRHFPDQHAPISRIFLKLIETGRCYTRNDQRYNADSDQPPNAFRILPLRSQKATKISTKHG